MFMYIYLNSECRQRTNLHSLLWWKGIISCVENQSVRHLLPWLVNEQELVASFQHWRKLSSSHLRMKAQRESCLLCFLSWSLHTACFDFLLKLLKIKETALSPSPKECSPHSVCAGPQKRECPRAKFHVQMNLLLVLGGR